MRRVFEALQAQSLPTQQWEILLVDNASMPPLSSALDISWHPNSRHIVEPELGLSPARLRGMREATGDLLVFVDDDNVLASNYLSEADRIGREWPQLGVWGSGATHPEFEVEPPPHLAEFLPALALRDNNAPCWSNVFTCKEASPNGAGLCVRASVAHAYREHSKRSTVHISDRRGNDLLTGGDVEICWVACHQGFGIGVFPELRIIHLIPKERIAEEYLLKLVEGGVISHHLLLYKWQGLLPQDPRSPMSLLSILRNMAVLRGMRRRMYLAEMKGALKASRLIAGHKTA
jgi:glycosyltransferase involved in cell wall biosynthesis